ncbi:EcoKI restriction-modification system protein HsdS [Chryseobacterium gleum]|uniref:EcoKI restriction-modification system protein HsdS n=2 Tax=Bacteroidota TaxID=976 RepID=A0A3S4MFA5_CHRGE|nr:restriction endonuclease subunit S [Chryseobacterium gleum]VEE10544.1 EcoKI restriction-modification system protein HsdS [Chryseobacterium gleum]
MRFPEFTEEWETKKLGEVATNVMYGMNAAATNYDGENQYIRITDIDEQTRLFCPNPLSSPDGELDNKYLLHKGDILFARTGASVGKSYLYNDKDGKIYFAGFLIRLNVRAEDPYFIFSQTLTEKYQRWVLTMSMRSGQPGINAEEYKLLPIVIPSIQEQEKISSFLSLIDSRIQTQNKIIEELKLLKITISKKLFSRQLRFKNGNNENYIDWNTKKLGEVTTLVNKRNKNNEKLPVYSINNKLGFVPQSEQFEGVDSEDRGYDIKLYKIIDTNTFAYNPARINVGSIGYSENLENIIISSLYVCFKTDNTVNDNFLYQYLKTDFFNREVLRNVEGGVRDYLFYDNFARIKFGLPCIEEQKKIADYLSSIDSKIDIESQLLHKFEKQKRYLLANLFI